MNLGEADAIVFDVDGTLVLSDEPNAAGGGIQVLAGAVEVLHRLRARHTPFVCFTNGSSQPPRVVAAKLRDAGLDIADEELLTPPVVAAEYIRRQHPGQLLLAFGDEGVREPLRQAGIPLARLDEAERAGVVLVGGDQDFTYAKLQAACRAVWAGAPLLVTSMAPFFASRRGRRPSPSGAIAAGIRHATGVEPKVVGKPSELVIEMIAAMFGTAPPRMAVVGDDLELEIRMARESGAFSVLVLSGSASESDLAHVSAEQRPHLVVPVVGDLLAHLGK